MSGSDYPSVRLVGNALPAEVLPAVAAHRLPRMSAGDYDLPLGMTPDNAAAHAYAYLQPIWQAWTAQRDRMPDPAAFTVDQWLTPLLRNLGFDHGRALTSRPSGVTIPTGFRDETATYPISHELVQYTSQDGTVEAAVPVLLLAPDCDLDRRPTGSGSRAPHSMLQEFLNRTQTRLYALVTNGQVLRLLRDTTNLDRQAYVEFDLNVMFGNNLLRDFRLMWLLLHATRFTPEPPAAVEITTLDDEDDNDEDDETAEVAETEDATEEAAPAATVVAAASPATCTLEKWRSTVFNDGTRALKHLREGIAAAITSLGTGFVRHPENQALRDALRDDPQADDHLRRWLLRCAYRLIVLMVAEDRVLLHIPTGSREARQRYRQFFSTARLRQQASSSNGSRHHDLWQQHRLVTDALGSDGLAEFGLPGLGASLYEPTSLGLLADAKISNHYFLAAVRHLSLVTDQHGTRRPIDYRNLDTEELGAAYEGLLGYVPRFTPADQVPDYAFTLELAAGSEQKKSGSYYTPTSLINVVLEETLDPLIRERLSEPDPETALLSITVCDPACGSGHFLVAAARRIARHLATVRTGDPEPSPDALRDAMRDVISRCIYGVDLNELAVEITKVALWLESLQPGSPFAFLDHHIKHGNGLLGTTPELIASGIPDAAFKVLPGDDKTVTASLKKRNKQEHKDNAQGTFFDAADLLPTTVLAKTAKDHSRVENLSQKTLAEARTFAKAWREADQSPELTRARLIADTWCTAFVQHKTEDSLLTGITQRVLQRASDGTLPDTIRHTVDGTRRAYRFFHWHLEFPTVFMGSSPGFTAILGNPPWETLRPKDKEFFAAVGRDDIVRARTAKVRRAMIASLAETDPALHQAYLAMKDGFARTAHVLTRSALFPLTGNGTLTTHDLFAEHLRTLTSAKGLSGLLIPTSVMTGSQTAPFVADLLATQQLAAFYDFTNVQGLFPGVDSRYRFGALVLSGASRLSTQVRLAFHLSQPSDLTADRLIRLSAEDLSRINPNTQNLPVFASATDAKITAGIHRKVPILRLLNDPHGNPWDITLGDMFNMSHEAHHFRSPQDLAQQGASFDGFAWNLNGIRHLPLHEGKHVWHYTHRFATGEGMPEDKTRPVSDVEAKSADFEIRTRHYVAETEVSRKLAHRTQAGWLIGWRDIAAATNQRTLIPAIFPRSAAGNKLPLFEVGSAASSVSLIAAMSSLPCDYVLRQKSAGADVKKFHVNQIPVPHPDVFAHSAPWRTRGRLLDWVYPRVHELVYTSNSLRPWAEDLGDDGEPFVWDPERRVILRAEIDAAMFHIYGLDRDETSHVLGTFRALRDAEMRLYGEYRTQRLVLDLYDQIAVAIRTGQPFRSSLTPQPGQGPRHPA